MTKYLLCCFDFLGKIISWINVSEKERIPFFKVFFLLFIEPVAFCSSPSHWKMSVVPDYRHTLV